LLGKASAAYPSKAPDLRNNPQIFDEWVEALENMDPIIAFENYRLHRASSKWFPDIADIVRLDPSQFTDHNLLAAHTEDRFAEMDEWEQKAIDCPPHLMRLKSGAEE